MGVSAPTEGSDPTDDARPFFEARREEAGAPEGEFWDLLDGIPDPHLPISLVEMGMIYDVRYDDEEVLVEMTFPCLGCPAYDMIQNDIRSALLDHAAVADVEIDIVWEPTWTKEMLAPEVRETLRQSGIGL